MSNNPLDTQTTVNTPDEVVTTEPVEINADNPLGADQTDSSPSSGWGKFLSTAGGIFTSIIGKIGQKKRDKEARKYQEKMYQQSLQDQKDLRDNEREYQSPLAQLTRLKEAGLNSHLMYGKGNLANSTQSTSVPSRTSVQPLSSPIPDMKLSPLDSLTMQQMLLNLEEKKQDIISKKISNEIADKTTDAQINITKNNARITAEERIQAVDQTNIQGEKLTQERLNTIVKEIETKVSQDPTSGTQAVATLRASLMQISLNQQEKTNPLEIEKLKSVIRQSNLNADVAEQNIRILTKQAELWEKGIKPNATLLEQYTDELIHTLINSDSPEITQAIEQLRNLPYVGTIIYELLQNRKKEYEATKPQ